MHIHHQIAAATRIGMLTRERDTVSACTQALRELAQALPLDVATLLAIDPLSGAHVQVAGMGYTAETSESMAAEFVTTPWYRSAVRQELPSICEETIPEGEFVGVSVLAANRDPDTFTDPLTYDIHRPNVRRSLAFSFGEHACLGLHLARVQTAIAVRALLERLPDPQIIGHDQPDGFAFRKPDNLRISWRVRPCDRRASRRRRTCVLSRASSSTADPGRAGIPPEQAAVAGVLGFPGVRRSHGPPPCSAWRRRRSGCCAPVPGPVVDRVVNARRVTADAAATEVVPKVRRAAAGHDRRVLRGAGAGPVRRTSPVHAPRLPSKPSRYASTSERGRVHRPGRAAEIRDPTAAAGGVTRQGTRPALPREHLVSGAHVRGRYFYGWRRGPGGSFLFGTTRRPPRRAGPALGEPCHDPIQ